MVYRLGFATSRKHARQLVRHNHITVNGNKVNIPSYLVGEADAISIREKSKKVTAVVEAVEAVERRGVPEWLTLDKDKLAGTVVAFPTREQMGIPFEEHLIVELYSK
jgi:small subunit ribosomal protein S4